MTDRSIFNRANGQKNSTSWSMLKYLSKENIRQLMIFGVQLRYSVVQKKIPSMLSIKKIAMNRQFTYWAAIASYTLLVLLQPMQRAAQAEPSLEAVAIDQAIRSNAMPGSISEMFASLKTWMGSYQKLREEGDSRYSMVFERGSLPIQLSGGLIGGKLGVGCPVTKLPLRAAPRNVRETFSKCPNLKS
jgi:hypothetical protein